VGPPRVRVDRHESELGSWELHRRTPQPCLRPHVRSYCGYVEDGTRPFRRRELPSGEVVVILGLGPHVRVGGEPRTSFVAGLHDEHAVTEHDGIQEGVQVNLTPLGAFALFGPPPSGVAGQVVDLEDLLGSRAPLLLERLFEARDWEARFALLDSLLSKELADGLPTSPDVARAWRRLTETDGRVSVGALAEELRCSRRHLTSRFREQVGLTPKAFAQILRFDKGIRRLRREGRRSLAEVAQDCGYYDQAHFNRDFRRFAGTTPTDLLASVLPDGGGFAGVAAPYRPAG
jgi:AraC-like DNA-binding protein